MERHARVGTRDPFVNVRAGTGERRSRDGKQGRGRGGVSGSSRLVNRSQRSAEIVPRGRSSSPAEARASRPTRVSRRLRPMIATMKYRASPWMLLIALAANAPDLAAQRARTAPAHTAITNGTTGFRLVPATSQVSYSVGEVFIEENNRFFTAVGKTTGVSGEILLHDAHPNLSRVRNISVDLRTLTSDSERRDRAIRERFLESRRYPYARIDSAAIIGLPGRITPGRAFAFQLTGAMNVHNVTRPTSWRGEATLSGDTLRGKATTEVRMSQFDIEVPRFLWLRVADAVTLEITFVAVKDSARSAGAPAYDPTPSSGGQR